MDTGDEAYMALAEDVLHEHEWHHAAIEIACTRAELLARKPLYRCYFEQTEAHNHEEALANASALSWPFERSRFSHDRASMLQKKTAGWMRRLGPGYREFDPWLPRRSFTKGLDRVARFMAAELPEPSPRIDSSLHSFLFRGTNAYRTMRVVVVNDLGSTATVARELPPEDGIDVRVHSNEHPPPHMHVLIKQSKIETRYLWPSPSPYPGDEPLPGQFRKKFLKYSEKHQALINALVQQKFGTVGSS